MNVIGVVNPRRVPVHTTMVLIESGPPLPLIVPHRMTISVLCAFYKTGAMTIELEEDIIYPIANQVVGKCLQRTHVMETNQLRIEVYCEVWVETYHFIVDRKEGKYILLTRPRRDDGEQEEKEDE
jgi:hypothetical protein